MKKNSPAFADLLGFHLQEVGWSERQLAERANIPRGTIRNWVTGVVTSPRDWRRLLRAAAALRLDKTQTDRLLNAADHPSLAALNAQPMSAGDALLFAPWKEADRSPTAFQVIPDIPYFVGREQELSDLENLLRQEKHNAIYVISGMAGVGKTALAAHLAYIVRDHFIDGVLWARVDTSDMMSLLRLFADALGEDVTQYSDRHSRSQAVRGLLSHKRILLILDNVENSRQVESLLPPNGPCAVILTTRHTNLQVARGNPQFQLKPFPATAQSSYDLFAKILGSKIARSQKKTLSEIADLLGQLPLALAIIAGRIAYDPHGNPGEFLLSLKAEKAKLEMLTLEDQSVQASFNASYNSLPLAPKRFFSALGILSGEDFSEEAAAAVGGVSLKTSQQYLALLYNYSLVQASKKKRYRLHPLVRDYARSKIMDSAVFERMVAYFARFVAENRTQYQALALESSNILIAIDLAIEHNMPTQGIDLVIDFAHYLTLVGLRELAASQLHRVESIAQQLGQTGSLARIKGALGSIEIVQSAPDALTYFKEALAAAQMSQDDKIIAPALKNMGLFYDKQAEFEQAVAYYEQSLKLAEETKQYELMGLLINNLASVANQNGDYRRAESLFLNGVKLQRTHNNLPALCLSLMNLATITHCLAKYSLSGQYLEESIAIAENIGYQMVLAVSSRYRAELVLTQQADYEQAYRWLTEGERIARVLNQPAVVGFVMVEFGKVMACLGQPETAILQLQEALAIAMTTGRRDIEIDAQRRLGMVALQSGRLPEATAHFQKALQSARAYQDVWFLAKVLDNYGECLLSQKQYGSARELFNELLAISVKSEFPELIGAAQFGLARILFAAGAETEARQLGSEAQARYTEIGHHKASIVSEWVARISN